MSTYTVSKSLQFPKRNLFQKIVSLICLALMLWVYSPLPVLADEGPSKEALAGAAVGTVGGTVAGAAGAVAVISAAGVAGTSAAGITSGLAAVGTIVGGGMAAGVTVAAALPVLGAVAGGAVVYGAVTLVQSFFSKPPKPPKPTKVCINYGGNMECNDANSTGSSQ